MRGLRTTSVADRDIIESARWFEQAQPGFGSQFLDAVDKALADVIRRPLITPTLVLPGRTLKAELRWCALDRFPRTVIFEVTNTEVVVHAVLHPHRDLESILISRIGTY